MRSARQGVSAAAAARGLFWTLCLLVFLRGALQAGTDNCPGDCDRSNSVTVDELVTGVNIALGLAKVGECASFDRDANGEVTVDEILLAVNAALQGCPAAPTPTATATAGGTLRIQGVCLRPGISGLIGCAVGTQVRAWRCNDRSLCPSNPAARTLVGSGGVGAGGSFVFFADASQVRNALMLLDADVEGAVVYRQMDFGPGGGGAGARATDGEGIETLEVAIDPISEAGVRLLDESGVDRFTDDGVRGVIEAVRVANAATVFAMLDAAAAADLAFAVAVADPVVQAALQTGLRPTATPTRSPTRTPTTDAASTPSRTPSSTPTPTRTATRTPTLSPTLSATSTRTPTSTPTFTQGPRYIDFGLAGGQVGSVTALPIELTEALVVSAIDLTVQYDANAFSFISCSGFQLEVSTEDLGGAVKIGVTLDPPRELFEGEILSCLFEVTGRSGIYPVSLSGTIIDGAGNRLFVSADGEFTIFAQCLEDSDCLFGQKCVDERCVDEAPTPTFTRTATSTRTATRTPTRTPTPETGPQITYLGILSASNQVLSPVDTLPDGTPVFAPATGLGFGFFILVEAKRGAGGALPGTSMFSATGRPDLQIQADRNLGSGSPQVCDANGIPGINPPSFDPGSAAITNALNDFGCRFEVKSRFQPCQGGGGYIDPASDLQVCTQGTVTTAYRFPAGDTRLTVRWRDTLGNLGPARSAIIRVR